MQSQHRGAGGTPGGSLSFFIGLIMASAGGYMLLDNIVVSNSWGFGARVRHCSNKPVWRRLGLAI